MTPAAPPRATVRLQLTRDFTFRDAAAAVPYLCALGASHIYASPILKARPGSTHGYDITDHGRLNPELGSEEDFEALVARLHDHAMGLVLDIVPNHMGVGGADNPWWMDVLEWGRASPYARYFDIDWQSEAPRLEGKLLLPFLGDHYGRVLESGQLELAFDTASGAFDVRYFGHRFPIAPRTFALILGQAGPRLAAFAARFAALARMRRPRAAREEAIRLRAGLAAAAREDAMVAAGIRQALGHINGVPGSPQSFAPLHDLLERQAYRLAYWRVATAEINYRRFFDVNDLAGIRIEIPALFDASHRLVLGLLAEGKVQGLRIDHVDGLYDPAAYLARLRRRIGGAWLIVEKILARHERLRADWPVDGTTGYDFMTLVDGLFVEPRAERLMTAVYERFIGRRPDLAETIVEARRQIAEGSLGSELTVLAALIHRIAGQSWRTRDFTLPGIRAALAEVLAHFPVYRTYVTPRRVAEEDRRTIAWAIAQARKASPIAGTGVFSFLEEVLTLDLAGRTGEGYRRADVVRAAMKAQQLTGPVAAKAVEDTAFYRYVRLAALSEVGGEPARFGTSPAAFHRASRVRARAWPRTMLATATHDHKRGEDVRARIAALTELAPEWRRRVARWAALNRLRLRILDGRPAPGRSDEYLLYQTLVGAWPAAGEPGPDFADRIVAGGIKAAREAKTRTSWTEPDAAYEEALEAFVRAILDPSRGGRFLEDFRPFAGRAAVIGAADSLSRTLLKLTVPGVPDIYRGAELWDLSLVDPDNRRPVDFAAAARLLAAGADRPLAALLTDWPTGGVKQQLIARILALRAQAPALFAEGDYVPLAVEGAEAGRIVAFSRRLGDARIVVVAPRLVGRLLGDAAIPLVPAEAWKDTRLAAGPDVPPVDLLTGRRHALGEKLAIREILDIFPVALFHREGDG
jgi:(1->4)-alpha-D-glucan 1-alpha-D-glucosylmutase